MKLGLRTPDRKRFYSLGLVEVSEALITANVFRPGTKSAASVIHSGNLLNQKNFHDEVAKSYMTSVSISDYLN